MHRVMHSPKKIVSLGGVFDAMQLKQERELAVGVVDQFIEAAAQNERAAGEVAG